MVRNIDKSVKVSVPVLLDHSSAFDTVDHKMLLAVLKQYFGVTDLALDWYRSYLCDRTQTFQVGSDSSIAFVVDCSVSQGSALGPLKCVAYTEDLHAVVEQYHVYYDIYADDTQLSHHPSIACVSDAVANIENCITSINKGVPSSDSSSIRRNPKSSGSKLPRTFVDYRAWTSDYTLAQTSSHPLTSSVISAFFLISS